MKPHWWTYPHIPFNSQGWLGFYDYAKGKQSSKYHTPACENGHLIGPMVKSLVPGVWVCPQCHAVYKEQQP